VAVRKTEKGAALKRWFKEDWMTAAEKKSRVAQKKRLGQPAGKPKRVKPLKRKK